MQVYRLPMSETGKFGGLLEQLEAQQAALGIGHCAVSMPTLVSVSRVQGLGFRVENLGFGVK